MRGPHGHAGWEPTEVFLSRMPLSVLSKIITTMTEVAVIAMSIERDHCVIFAIACPKNGNKMTTYPHP